MTPSTRPLSPHLQVYRLPLTGIVSITHRITGMFLSLGLVLFVWILVSMSAGNANYLAIQKLLQQWPAQLILWCFLYSLFFHLCHGVRHLIWDAGSGFDRDAMNRNIFIELALSILLTLAALFFYLTGA